MGNLIADLLEAKEPEFSQTILRLEKIAGNPGVDVALMSEIIQTNKRKVSELGLDAADTTGEELYYLLLNKAKIHNQHLARHIGVGPDDHVDNIALSIKKVIEKSGFSTHVWAIKRSVLKRLLAKNPPRNVMNYLHYTSIDSMLKRENIAEVMCAARLMEDEKWLHSFNKLYVELLPVDFENRKIELVVMNNARWRPLIDMLYANKRHNISHLKEAGFIAIFVPQQTRMEGYVLATLPIVIHYINELRTYSSYFNLNQVKADFGKRIVDVLNDDLAHHVEISGHRLHWRTVHRYFGGEYNGGHLDLWQPHVQPDDLAWRRTEEYLFTINPELSFWRGLDFVGVRINGAKPVSMSLLDVSNNYYFALSYQDRMYQYMQKSLHSELFVRYMKQKIFETQIIHQLSTDNIVNDFLDF